MSFVSGLFSGSSGANFQGTGSDLQTPVSNDWAQQAYGQNKDALLQQQQFLQALQGQNGIGNQSQVYNQLQGVANGTGPNPAQAMLNNSTGQNIAAQSALMAGQRGAGANTGLIARQAAQQGANTQQQAIGQGAALQANQSLNALNSVGNIATNQVQQQANAQSAYNQGAANQANTALNQINAQNNAKVGMQTNLNNVNAGIAQGNQAFQSGLTGGILQGAGSALAMAKGGKVEAPKKMADGGGIALVGPQSMAGQYLNGINAGSTPMDEGSASNSHAAEIKAEATKTGNQLVTKAPPSQGGSPGDLGGGTAGGADVGSIGSSGFIEGAAPMAGEALPAAAMLAARGGKVPALVSPGEVYLPPGKAKAAASGKANAMKSGEKIPGKPKVDGAVNSYANDTVHKDLEAGGIVIPRSITQGKNAEEKAQAFVRAVMAHSNMKKSRK